MSDGPTPEQLAQERAAIALAQGLDRAIMFAAASFCSQPSPIGAVACVGRRQPLAFTIEDAWRVRQAQKRAARYEADEVEPGLVRLQRVRP